MYAVLRAEFPNFEVLQSFELFSLDAEHTDDFAISSKRLCRVVGLDEDTFLQQWRSVRPAAYQLRKSSATVLDAWVDATVRLRKVVASGELRAGLLRFAVWSESTSGVERIFGKGVLLKGSSRVALDDGLVDDDRERCAAAGCGKAKGGCEPRVGTIWRGGAGKAWLCRW